MKIGIVLSKTPSYSETFFINKIKGLQLNGHEVILFVQQKDDEFNLCKVVVASKIYKRNLILQFFLIASVFFSLLPYINRVKRFIFFERLAKRSWKQLFGNMYSNAHILKSDLDWVHFGFATMALQSEHVAKAIHAKMAVSFRGFDIAIYPLRNPDCYHFLWKYLDKAHTISDDLLSLAYKLGMYNETPYLKITPAINIENFKPYLKNNIDFNQHQINIYTIARLHWKKGLLDILQAMLILKQKGIDFHYTIVGEGLEYEPLSYAIHQLGLTSRVTLIGKKKHNEVVELLDKCDLYIQYSISEGFCNAVLEAQAMKCLCVVSDAEGLSENVLHDKTGWVVSKGKPELLANRLLNIIELPNKTKQIIKTNARERIIDKFSLERQNQYFLKFYEVLPN